MMNDLKGILKLLELFYSKNSKDNIFLVYFQLN